MKLLTAEDQEHKHAKRMSVTQKKHELILHLFAGVRQRSQRIRLLSGG